MTQQSNIEQAGLAAILEALGRQIERRFKDGPNAAAQKYGWYEVTNIGLRGEFPATIISVSVRYCRDASITTVEEFEVWDSAAPEGQGRTSPEIAPGVVLTNLEEWVATDAFFQASRK